MNKNYHCIVFVGACISAAIAAETTNLSKYQLSVLPGFKLDLFAEPALPPPKPKPGELPPSPAVGLNRARILISPFLSAPIDSIFITDENGDWIKEANLSTAVAANAKVAIKLTVTLPPFETDLSWKKQIIAAIYNIPSPPPLSIRIGDSVVFIGGGPPQVGGPVVLGSTNYFIGGGPEAAFQWYLDSHSFEPLGIRGLRVRVSCNGTEFDEVVIAQNDEFIPIQTSFTVYVNPLTVANIKAIRRGQLQIKATYYTTTTNTEVATVVSDLTSYTSYVTSRFMDEFRQQSSSGFSFLGFGSVRTSISKWLGDQASASTGELSVSSKTVILRNVTNQRMMDAVDSFAWPNIAQAELIKNHLEAALKAQQDGNRELAKAHNEYAAAVKAASNNQPPPVDTAKALAAIAVGDVAGFLANGIAFSNSGSTGSLSYRRLRNAQFSSQDIRQLNELFITSVETKNTGSISDFPLQLAISRARDANPDGALSREVLKNIFKDADYTQLGTGIFDTLFMELGSK